MYMNPLAERNTPEAERKRKQKTLLDTNVVKMVKIPYIHPFVTL